MKLYSVYLHHPFTMLVSGPTGSGKTYWIKRLIESRNVISKPAPSHITYFYGEWQSVFSTMKSVRFIKGLPDNLMDMFDGTTPQWIIIDDLMHEVGASKMIAEIFTKGSHHRNLSIILLVQNFFMRGNESRNISLNTQYIVLFKNPRDQSIATNIARQMFPSKTKKFQKVHEDATKEPHSYLFVDLKPATEPELRLLTNIFGEGCYMQSYSL